jgi:hypothetical protein
VRWVLDGDEVCRATRIGHHLESRAHLLIDLGGKEDSVAPRQLAFGIGVFTGIGEETGRILVLFTPAGLEEFFREAGLPATTDRHRQSTPQRLLAPKRLRSGTACVWWIGPHN